MRNLTVAFLFCLASSIANAQDTFKINKPISCANADMLIKELMKTYGEKPVWTGKSDVDATAYLMMINEKTGTWTSLQFDNDVACILGVGSDSRLILGNPV